MPLSKSNRRGALPLSQNAQGKSVVKAAPARTIKKKSPVPTDLLNFSGDDIRVSFPLLPPFPSLMFTQRKSGSYCLQWHGAFTKVGCGRYCESGHSKLIPGSVNEHVSG